MDGPRRLTLSGCLVDNNSASDGGGIYSLGVLTITDSTISNNIAFGTSAGGGGIFVKTLWGIPLDGNYIINSTISGNSTQSNGGGICITYPAPFSFSSTWVFDSTISGNSSAKGGVESILRENTSTQWFIQTTMRPC